MLDSCCRNERKESKFCLARKETLQAQRAGRIPSVRKWWDELKGEIKANTKKREKKLWERMIEQIVGRLRDTE